MFKVVRERVFSASHQLRGYKGKCERLHGHNWKVRVCVVAKELDDMGMVIDFHELDGIMEKGIDPFEHQHLNEIPPFDSINPSSENLARVLFESIRGELRDSRANVSYCEVWENDLSMACYFEED